MAIWSGNHLSLLRVRFAVAALDSANLLWSELAIRAGDRSVPDPGGGLCFAGSGTIDKLHSPRSRRTRKLFRMQMLGMAAALLFGLPAAVEYGVAAAAVGFAIVQCTRRSTGAYLSTAIRAGSWAAAKDRGMTSVTAEAWIPEKTATRSTSKLLTMSMLLYAISMMKFYIRDPLSQQTGPQGIIEVLLVTGAAVALVPALRGLHHGLFIPPVAKAFMLFGVLAAVSSVFSYDPLLSLVKAISFLMVCGIAVTASSAFRPAQVLRSFFYAVTIVLAAGLIYKLASGGPWFDIDSYSGRARLWLFALTPLRWPIYVP